MTTGIYALYWEQEPDLVYIGQSINIQKRYKNHIYNLCRNTHSNYKVLNKYIKYNTLPNLEIIEVCEVSELDVKEIYWTKEFNSIVGGLNIVEAGHSLQGIDHPRSKYSLIEILKVFGYNSLHKYKHLTAKEIAKIVGVNKSLVASIRCGDAHIWLKEKYPYIYNRMLSIDRPAIGGTIAVSYILKSPEGTNTTVPNLCVFAKENKLDYSALYKVVRGERPHHKGWTFIIEGK